VGVIKGRARSVGLWVSPVREEVAALDEYLSLDLLQFHGDEEPAAADWFPDRVIQAIRLGPDRESVRLEGYDSAWGFLFDCAPPGVYGGSGKSWSYERIAHLEASKPVLLAGGLDPENVASAIIRSGADFVDVCSGVEASPGIKDPDLLARFFKEVRNAQTRD
jgi:phosphoribosylanthranilate isomerase